jgi:hypothetical protein
MYYGSTQPTSSPHGKQPLRGHCPLFAKEKNAADTIFSDDSGRRARRNCDGANAGCRQCAAFGTQRYSRRNGAATRCTATASKSRAALTAFKRLKKPAAGELRASWCRPSRPLRRCPRNICRKGRKLNSSEPARVGLWPIRRLNFASWVQVRVKLCGFNMGGRLVEREARLPRLRS